MKRFSVSPDMASTVLRIGLGCVFIEFGLDKMSEAGAWLMFFPPWISGLFGESTGVVRAVQTQGLLELVIGIHLVAGLLTRQIAAAVGVFLIAVTITVGWTPIGVRDVGLVAAACALAFLGPGAWSIDNWWHRTRPVAFPGPTWCGVLGVGVAVFFLRPSAGVDVAQAMVIPSSVAGPFQPIPSSVQSDEGKVQLGQLLFRESRLSGDETVSCASCHSSDFFGADGRVVSIGVDGHLTRRNSPTVFNSAFHFRQFWDGRARTLEEQVEGPILSPDEMASSWDLIIERLTADSRYNRMFRATYSDGVTRENVMDAIAEFERTLITPNSRFDQYLMGDEEALTRVEMRGFDRFRTLGCSSCHHGVVLGGNSFQTLGKYADYFGEVGSGSAIDYGRFEITDNARDRFVFKVPGLRNVAETAPYFHDGSVATLEDAVRLMGRYQLGYELPDLWIDELVAFLHTLTGEAPRI